MRVVPTFGLTHLALHVKDPERAFEFYERVFGIVAVYRDGDVIQGQTPGARDIIVFERSDGPTGDGGGIAHFGFRLTKPDDMESAIEAVKKAGGEIVETGEFVPGEPYAFVRDPDGYSVEIWYEIPTVMDPVTDPEAFTHAEWRVKPGSEDEFIAAWKGLADSFSALPGLPLWGTLIQSEQEPSLFFSFGPWKDPAHIAAMRADPAARSAMKRVAELCERATPGTYRRVAHVELRALSFEL